MGDFPTPHCEAWQKHVESNATNLESVMPHGWVALGIGTQNATWRRGVTFCLVTFFRKPNAPNMVLDGLRWSHREHPCVHFLFVLVMRKLWHKVKMTHVAMLICGKHESEKSHFEVGDCEIVCCSVWRNCTRIASSLRSDSLAAPICCAILLIFWVNVYVHNNN